MGCIVLEAEIERIEVNLLLEGIRLRWGYDFTHYSYASLKRRLNHARDEAGCARFTDLLDVVMHDPLAFDRLLEHMSINVTEMFRDPAFYLSVREIVIPTLKTFPFVKVWHAGCSTGEEVYSMAILLHEENFLSRAQIYGTDFNKHSLDVAEKCVYPARNVAAWANNYQACGGKRNFGSYYNSAYDLVTLKNFLKTRITFAYHNLVTDGVFGEMNLISCRNVLIYFDKILQDRVLTLFADSLRHGGFLCLGAKETLNFSGVKGLFEAVDGRQKIYRKRGAAHV
jgi:chemotaxis protein methyltransferase CheR